MPDRCYRYTMVGRPETFERPKPKKKISRMTLILFWIKWCWKNRKWQACRHKGRMFRRDWMKYVERCGYGR